MLDSRMPVPGDHAGRVGASAPRKLTIHQRWLIGQDYREVVEIEGRSRAHRPWSEGDLVARLRGKSTVGMVAELGNRVIGFTVYDLEPRGIEVLRLAVHPAFRRCGVGRQMAARLIGKLDPERRTTLRTEVGERDLGACLFLKSQGFLWTGYLPPPCGDAGEDGYAMEYRMAEPPVVAPIPWDAGRQNTPEICP